jgi:hypothetical protein
MTEDGEVLVLRPAIAQAFDPESEDDRGVLQLLIALECFRAADEAYLAVSEGEGKEAVGRRCIYFLLKAGYLTEAFKAFMWLDGRGWFKSHLPRSPKTRRTLKTALSRLRALVREEPAAICPCCKRVHDDWPRQRRLPPSTLQRLRNKAGFHWDPDALRKAYRSLIESGEQPATLRLRGRSIRGVHSPLAGSLLTLVIGDGSNPESDRETVQLIIDVGGDLRTLAQLAVGAHLSSVGARLELEPPGPEAPHADLEP